MSGESSCCLKMKELLYKGELLVQLLRTTDKLLRLVSPSNSVLLRLASSEVTDEL